MKVSTQHMSATNKTIELTKTRPKNTFNGFKMIFNLPEIGKEINFLLKFT